MARLPWLLLVATLALAACSRTDGDREATPLPTRKTTIEPVNAKLEAAAQDVERRRQDVDNAAK